MIPLSHQAVIAAQAQSSCVLRLVAPTTNPGYYVPIKEVRQRKNTRTTENMKFLWGGSGIGHATIKVKTHRHSQKDNNRVKR